MLLSSRFPTLASAPKSRPVQLVSQLYPASLNGVSCSAIHTSPFSTYSVYCVQQHGLTRGCSPANDVSLSVVSDPYGGSITTLGATDIYDVKQQFRVTCRFDCGDDHSSSGTFIGDVCTISAVGDTTKCVQVGEGPNVGKDGDSISLRTCDDAVFAQKFNFENKTISAL